MTAMARLLVFGGVCLLVLIVILTVVWNRPPKTDTHDDSDSDYSDSVALYVQQGWNEDERHTFYYLSQGSQLVPYNWFVNLELPQSAELLRSDRHLASLGFITQSREERRNPDGLPIGFAKDDNPSTVEMKAAFLGPEYKIEHFPKTNVWLGFTCAACHTAELRYNGKVIRIDGGAAMADPESFLSTLAASMRATITEDEKFARFEKKISDGGNVDTTALHQELEAFTAVIEAMMQRNKATHPYGLARVDAFGAILNQICEVALQIPENHRPANAPVSFPFLWDAPHLDWVQWNSSADIAISRNVGEVLGVFAHVKLTGTPADGQFSSSARVDFLDRLESIVSTLKAPPWPEEHFGKIDTDKAAAGKELFTKRCASCHNERNENGEFEMTPPNKFGKQFIKTTSVPFQAIGTDPQMVLNFVTHAAKPGALAESIKDDVEALKKSGGLERLKQLRASLGLPELDISKEVPRSLLLKGGVRGVIQRDLNERLRNQTAEEKQQIVLTLNGHREVGNPAPNGGIGYKARPLNGVWATAPFLHNGSVPSLYQLLLPEEQRVKSFHVGSREFEPIQVGFKTEPIEGSFLFQTQTEDGTPIPGNSNKGHSSKPLTDFTDDERWAIIEYMKTMK